ncbi:MAG: hypothetical protein IT279_01035 [Ignavibacteriaceae bacterium]|nr:hypothetical protein [Ignavibacteriaceae bacterium]
MDDIIQYLIYGLIFYYFFLGGKKKKPAEKKPEPQNYPREQTSHTDQNIEYHTEPVSSQQPGSDDLLKEVEKILGLPPRPETTRAEMPEMRRKSAEPVIRPPAKVYRQEDFASKISKIPTRAKADDNYENDPSMPFVHKILTYDYDVIPSRGGTGVPFNFAKDLRENLKKKKNLQEMFIFSEIINRPGRHRRLR